MGDYARFTDQELSALMRQGDRLAFAQIFKKYNRILFVHACKKLERKDIAEDVVQEVFTTLWLKKDDLFVVNNLSGYLYTTTRNRCLDVIARNKVESKYIDSLQQFSISSNAITDHLVRERQMKLYIEQEIERLPVKMRRVFELSRKEHLSHKEIAERLAISEQTVTDQIKKALKILRKRMLSYFFIV